MTDTTHRATLGAPRSSTGGGTTAAVAAAFALLAVGQAAALQTDVQRVEHALEVGASTRVTVLNFAGQVEVHGTDPGEDSTLRIVGVKRLTADLPPDEAARWFARIDLEPERRGRNVHIGPRALRARSPAQIRDSEPSRDAPVTDIRAPRRIPPVSVDIELWLPFGSSLEVRTFSAPITVVGVGAPDGSFRLRSVSGSVRIEGVEADDLRVDTVSGALRLLDAVAHRGHFQTLAAPIRARGALHPEGWYDFQSHSGEVRLELDPIPGFVVDARTYGGEIRNELGIEAESGSGSLEVRTGASGPHLSVNTFDGLIHLISADSPATTPDR